MHGSHFTKLKLIHDIKFLVGVLLAPWWWSFQNTCITTLNSLNMIPGTWSWKKKESNVAQTETQALIVLLFVFLFRWFSKSQKSCVIEQTFTLLGIQISPKSPLFFLTDRFLDTFLRTTINMISSNTIKISDAWKREGCQYHKLKAKKL